MTAAEQILARKIYRGNGRNVERYVKVSIGVSKDAGRPGANAMAVMTKRAFQRDVYLARREKANGSVREKRASQPEGCQHGRLLDIS